MKDIKSKKLTLHLLGVEELVKNIFLQLLVKTKDVNWLLFAIIMKRGLKIFKFL